MNKVKIESITRTKKAKPIKNNFTSLPAIIFQLAFMASTAVKFSLSFNTKKVIDSLIAINIPGIINKISVNYDGSASLTEALYTSVKMKYIGTPTVAVTLDGVANISATTLSAPTGAVGEGTLYFAAMSTGVVPHLKETNDEASGRILEFSYTASEV